MRRKALQGKTGGKVRGICSCRPTVRSFGQRIFTALCGRCCTSSQLQKWSSHLRSGWKCFQEDHPESRRCASAVRDLLGWRWMTSAVWPARRYRQTDSASVRPGQNVDRIEMDPEASRSGLDFAGEVLL